MGVHLFRLLSAIVSSNAWIPFRFAIVIHSLDCRPRFLGQWRKNKPAMTFARSVMFVSTATLRLVYPRSRARVPPPLKGQIGRPEGYFEGIRFRSPVDFLEQPLNVLLLRLFPLRGFPLLRGYACIHAPYHWLLSRDVRAFLGGGRFHQENQKGEYNGNHRENQERVEIGKSRGLLFAKILKRL
jgi:hypothetical protein